jgi:predicted O-linked N-acetylglucosamine transferase (SPINDLY family)
MGVPVVTLVGPVHRQRVTYSMLKNIGVEKTIAWTEEEYVQCATSLARDPARLHDLRGEIHRAVRASILCNPAQFTREYEAALLAAWRERSLIKPAAG